MARFTRPFFALAIITTIMGKSVAAQSALMRGDRRAIEDYRAGMRILANAKQPKLDDAEALFQRAAHAGLPHADYGLACVMYRRGNGP